MKIQKTDDFLLKSVKAIGLLTLIAIPISIAFRIYLQRIEEYYEIGYEIGFGYGYEEGYKKGYKNGYNLIYNQTYPIPYNDEDLLLTEDTIKIIRVTHE